MKKMKKLLIQYKDLIIEELAERMKDVIYANAEKQARTIFTNVILRQVTDSGDSIDATYTISFVVNDLLQIAARKERLEEDHFDSQSWG